MYTHVHDLADALSAEVRSSALTSADLYDGLKILYLVDGLFYEAHVKEILPPDVYGVVVKGKRASKPTILSREELLQDAVSPPSCRARSCCRTRSADDPLR